MSPSPIRKPSLGGGDDDDDTSSLRSDINGTGGGAVRGGTAMRIIVPLQGVVQGRGGLVLGSVIPCALFYFLQLYLRRNRPSSSPSPSPSPSSNELPALPGIPRTHSRNLLSPRGASGPALVSSRTAAVNRDDASRLVAGQRRCLDDPYHPLSNPDGVLQLGLVENQLSLDLVQNWFERNAKACLLDKGKLDLNFGGMATYPWFDGLLDMKIAVAGFVGEVMQGSVSFSPSQMILTAGAASAIETLSFCLTDAGNAILIPSPYHPGYDRDLKWRTGVDLIAVPCRSTDNFNMSIAALERAYNQAKKRGVKVRAVLFSNPSNPVGNLLSRETLCDLLQFTAEKNIHLISDELFVGSFQGHKKFVSIAEVLDAEDFDKSRVHIVYRLSDDLSLQGFHIGVIYTSNDDVLAAAAKFTRFSCISIPAQLFLVPMLSDKQFASEFTRLSRERLKKMRNVFVEGLKSLGINCAGGGGGFSCWADMSKFLRSYSEKGELEMWEKLLEVAKINATPGSSCHCIEPGWFQFCFTALSEIDISVVLERIRMVTEGLLTEVHCGEAISGLD
ncbi:putative aminotransferase ACS12 [Apostasia shenzhenica]|uniref:Putative aminotransferase ACS12 n=1 Tax=Apostasia shenzhenica TaxID=1088818 RepID=A0A2I0AR41_9ASPA|nr:putative aminotransferase ACS12 [Apostasia shenzhenica]